MSNRLPIIIEKILGRPADDRTIEVAKKRLDWAVGFLTVSYSFVYQVLGILHRHVQVSKGTMGVWVQGGQLHLAYDPNFVMELKDSWLTFVLYHEVLHLVLRHCTNRKFADNDIGGIATDLAVNELVPIKPGSCEPTMRNGKRVGVFVDDLRKMPEFKDIKNKQSAEWYYNFLMEHAKKVSSAGEGKPGKNKGQPGKDSLKSDQTDDHSGWDPNDEIADERVKAKVSDIAKNALWGNVSSSDQEVIMAAQTKRIDWRALLKMLMGAFSWHERESTRKRVNRRTGFIHPGYRKLKVDRQLVVIDTSGSTFMGGLLGRFLTLVNSMVEECPIDLAQVDCSVTEQPKPYEQHCKEFTFKGNGGTSFDPIMDIVDEKGYKSVVIFTDGQASAPREPKNARVIWVTPEGMEPPVD
jgi:predicted metal-dependent peptidase